MTLKERIKKRIDHTKWILGYCKEDTAFKKGLEEDIGLFEDISKELGREPEHTAMSPIIIAYGGMAACGLFWGIVIGWWIWGV